jgi:hypothetical protein
VRHAEILAPLSGTVSAVHVKTIGTVVQAGTVLVDIVLAELVCWRGPGFAETVVSNPSRKNFTAVCFGV